MALSIAVTADSNKPVGFSVHGLQPKVTQHMAGDKRCEFFTLGHSGSPAEPHVALFFTRNELISLHAYLGKYIETLLASERPLPPVQATTAPVAPVETALL